MMNDIIILDKNVKLFLRRLIMEIIRRAISILTAAATTGVLILPSNIPFAADANIIAAEYTGEGNTKGDINLDGEVSISDAVSHINDEIRKSFKVKKVNSSHTKGETVIISETDIPDISLKSAVSQTGYRMISANHVPYEKRGLLDRLLKKK